MSLMSLAYKIPLAEKMLDFVGVDTTKVKEILSDFADKVSDNMEQDKGLVGSVWEAMGDTAQEISDAASNGELSKSKDDEKSEVSEHTEEYVASKTDTEPVSDEEKTKERVAQAEAAGVSVSDMASAGDKEPQAGA